MSDTQYVDGLSRLAHILEELPKNVARNCLRTAVSSGAALIRDEAKNRAPVDTGEMRRDIMIKRERSDNQRAIYSVFVRAGKRSRLSGKGRDVSKDSFYWRFVEFGTSKMAAHPFMRPAFDTMKDQAVSTIADSLKTRIPTEIDKLKGGV